ncbi:farnesyl pyrophosphate synthase-like [Leptopilina boulardi]|uniref:farnesyl pyrophosphate synthase-like n=1 Tax=Leptopilina boulardi TaxID=63433 RepID=UPI0021F651CB|nr:farnesyl pyrophosphate synthase-like [Leptopilina boulardi]
MRKFLMTVFNKRVFNVRMVHTVPQRKLINIKDENQELMALWPRVFKDLTVGRHTDLPDVTRWLSKLLQYNVPGGKKNRSLILVYAYKQFAHPNQLTDGNIRLARILGWCNEMLQAFFLIEDDIVDRSKTRRGQPCWYLHDNIGTTAVNDGILIEQMIYQLLRMHFGDKPYYLDFVNTFLDIIYKSMVGQTLDLLSSNHAKKPKLNLFTMDRYNAIVNYKTAYYSFVMPVTLAMHLAGIKDKEMFRQATNILLEIGNLFQVQDDYLDCFGDPQVTGKVGTDIEQGKCSWLVVVALQRVTSEQRKILEECYGTNDMEKVARVKQLYRDLGLQTTYSVYEEENYNLINTHIQQISCGLPHDIFFKILNKIYRRNM